MAEAVRLISGAARQDMVLRALGSVGVKMHCASASSELESRGRSPKDIDLVTRKRDRKSIRSFFEESGYEADRDMLVAMEGTRYLFRHPSGIDVDLWVDVLDFCHKHDVSDRMGTGPSLPIEDLLLSKLQIVELTENDRHDLAAILGTHDVGVGGDPEVIDVDYVADVLARDWGYWRTVTGNLSDIKPLQSAEVVDRIERLASAIDDRAKTVRWKTRALVGERSQWWSDVDVPRDTY
jgi:hypothetical protein